VTVKSQVDAAIITINPTTIIMYLNSLFVVAKHFPADDYDERKRSFYHIKLRKIIQLQQRNGKAVFAQLITRNAKLCSFYKHS